MADPVMAGPDDDRAIIPYAVIRSALRDGLVVPFLGAGVHTPFRPKGAAFRLDDECEFLPLGGELAEVLAHRNGFPSLDPRDRQDLPKVASYAVGLNGRPLLRNALRNVFGRQLAERDDTDVHRFLASIDEPMLIMTTNYDDAMERALRAAGRVFDVVVHAADVPEAAAAVLWWKHGETQPAIIAAKDVQLNPEDRTVVYKMHGSVWRPPETIPPMGRRERERWDSFVISEEDYAEFLYRMMASTALPAMLSTHCEERNFLFLGYGLRDWNFRVVLHMLQRCTQRSLLTSVAGWAIQHDRSALEKELWKSRGVNVYTQSIEDFVRAVASKRGLNG